MNGGTSENSQKLLTEDDDEQDDDFVLSEENDEEDASSASQSDSESIGRPSLEGNGEESPSMLPPMHVDRKGLLQVLAGEELPFDDEQIYSESEISLVFSDGDEESLEDLAGVFAISITTHKEQEHKEAGEFLLEKQGTHDSHNNENNSMKSHSPAVQIVSKVDGQETATRGKDETELDAGGIQNYININTDDDHHVNVLRVLEKEESGPLLNPSQNMEETLASHQNGDVGNAASSCSPGVDHAPIAQRTRANVSLLDVPIEELEAALMAAPEEPVLTWGVDDAEEYERFLQSLRLDVALVDCSVDEKQQCIGNQRQSHPATIREPIDRPTNSLLTFFNSDDDSDDEDFLLEFRREFGLEHLSGEIQSRRKDKEDVKSKKRTTNDRKRSSASANENARRKKQLRRSERLAKAGQYPNSFARWNERQMWHRAQLLQFMTGASRGLGQLADLAVVLGNHSMDRVLLPSQSVADILAETHRVVWCPPVPKRMRKFHGSDRSSPGMPNESFCSSQSAKEAVIVGGMIHPEQYKPLHRLIHSHVQLLMQTLMLSTLDDADVAKQSYDLLFEFLDFVSSQTMIRMTHHMSPYLSHVLGVTELGPQHHVRRISLDMMGMMHSAMGYEDNIFKLLFSGPQQDALSWTPVDPGVAYSVSDCALLRFVPGVLRSIPRVESAAVPYHGPDGQQCTRGESSLPHQLGVLKAGSGGNASTSRKSTAPENKRQRRKEKSCPHRHAVWTSMPDTLSLIVQPLLPYFDPDLEPRKFKFTISSQMLFSPAEDELLAWGIRKYGYDWERIRKEFMPCKTATTLFHRKKNRTAGRCGDNVIKQAVNLITGPLTEAEIRLLTKATDYYGSKQAGRWNIIVRDHLPYRNPSVLSMLWSEYLKSSKPTPATHLLSNNSMRTETRPLGDMLHPLGDGTIRSRKMDCLDLRLAGDDVRHQAGIRMDHNGQGISIKNRDNGTQLTCQNGGTGQLLLSENNDGKERVVGMAAGHKGGVDYPSHANFSHIQPFHTQSQPSLRPKDDGNMATDDAVVRNGRPRNTTMPRADNSKDNCVIDATQAIDNCDASMRDSESVRDSIIEPRNISGDENLQTNRGLGGPSAWSAEADKLILKTALLAGGELQQSESERLASTLCVHAQDITQRSAVLVTRFMKKASRRVKEREDT